MTTPPRPRKTQPKTDRRVSDKRRNVAPDSAPPPQTAAGSTSRAIRFVRGAGLSLVVVAAVGAAFWFGRQSASPSSETPPVDDIADADSVGTVEPAPEVPTGSVSSAAEETPAPPDRVSVSSESGTSVVQSVPEKQTATRDAAPSTRPDDTGRPSIPAVAGRPEPAEPAVQPNATDPPPATASKPSHVVFRPLPLEEPATSFAMTEDGRFVVMSHQAANRITVYDVAGARVAATISTLSPRSLLCRGDLLFAGNFGEGTVSVFSASQGWKLTNELQVDKPNIVFMSAPRGDHFGGEILVTCHGDGPQASYRASWIYRLDANRDRCEQINRSSMASVSYDGKIILTQGSFNLSPSGRFGIFPYEEFLSDDPKALSRGGGIQQTPYVYQPYPGSYWIAENMIFGGMPLALVHKDVRKLIIPDIRQKVVYALDEDLLEARRLNANLTEVEARRRRVEFPDEQAKSTSRIFHQLYRRRSYHLDHPVAVTLEDSLSLFLIDQKNGMVLSATTPAFASSQDIDRPHVIVSRDERPPAGNDSPARPDHSAAGAVDRTVGFLNGWPTLVVAGRRFEFPFPAVPGQRKFALMDGPKGMQIASNGLLSWVPSEQDVGVHELKIRIEQEGRPFFERPVVEVISAELAESVGDDLSKVNQFARRELDPDHYAISSGHGGESLLLLQGSRLWILGSDGMSVVREMTLPNRYHFIEEREDSWVAVSTTAPSVDIIDKRTLKVRRHTELELTDLRVLEITDLAIHPQLATCFVCIKHSVELPRYTVLMVDEQTGRATVPGIPGTWAEVDPSGDYLYTGYRDLYERGVRFHINPGWRLIEIPEYGNVDMLLAWNIRRKQPSLQQVVRRAGGNGKGIRLAPDARRIIYLSHVGTPMHSKNLAGFDPHDLDGAAVRYETNGRASTSEAAFHPFAPWVAMPGKGTVVVFHSETGAPIGNRLLTTEGGLGTDTIDRLYFSPDGQSLLLLRSGGESGRYLQRVPLRLSESERQLRHRKPARRATGRSESRIVPKERLDSLSAAVAGQAMTPLEVGREFMDSVVVVLADKTSGSGFVVGRDGYVLTSEHVVSAGDSVSVAYRSADSTDEFQTATASVVRADEDLDLALLHFQPNTPLKPVRLGGDGPMETGEPVTVIGNPGAGDAILNHTMTSGIVSNPRRIADGQRWIQLSAAVNPGNSGGPMFDSRGNVAGLVAARADAEGVSFAVPAGTLRKFLQAATSGR